MELMELNKIIYVEKRNGTYVEFNADKIANAVMCATREVRNADMRKANKIASSIEDELMSKDQETFTIETIQEMVIERLEGKVKERYIRFRERKNMERKLKPQQEFKLLSDEFISQYKHVQPPMTDVGMFTYLRTYSRYIPELGRREYWWETCRRAIEYNARLVPNTTVAEAQRLFDNMFNCRQFLSGRSLWVGGTDIAKEYVASNYNCAFQCADSLDVFSNLIYLAMLGAGTGIRITREYVDKLPKLRNDIDYVHKIFEPVKKVDRAEHTSLIMRNKSTCEIVIGDSKEAHTEAVDYFFKILSESRYKTIKNISFNYNNVRPRGEKLKRFGGRASGYESLQQMFSKITGFVLGQYKEESVKLKPIDVGDIANIIGENVVSGGVRRTSIILLGDRDDQEFLTYKSNLYTQDENDNWIIDKQLAHRKNANITVVYKVEEGHPDYDTIKKHIDVLRYSGEPGFMNEQLLTDRHPNSKGANPCFEIILDSRGLCNLTTVNVLGFVKNKELDIEGIKDGLRLSARASLRMTIPTIELHEWDLIQKRDRQLGCSMTGWQDMVNEVGLTKEEERLLLRELYKTVREEADKYAQELGVNAPLLVTALKPEGTLSLLPTVSPGVHYSHSEHYVRRIRISADDPLVKVCEDLGYPVFPEVGQDMATCTTKVVEFPVKAPHGKTKADVSAIEQLENYKMFMEEYVDQNCSITVHVRDDEWEGVTKWVHENWTSVAGITFLSYNDNFYNLLPYEEITEEEYVKRVHEMKPFDVELLSKHEKEETDLDIGNEGCEGGHCPVR